MSKLLFRNPGWKLLSLVIAVALWLTLVGEQELTTSTSVPIVFKNIPRDLEISSDVPDRVHLEIQGPVGKLSNLSNPMVMLDLGDVSRAGEKTFTIRQANVNLPLGVTLSRALPGQIRLRFERRVAREVPVQVRFAGTLPDGLRVARQEVRPPTVKIVGPESRVGLVEYAETDPIDLSQATGEAEYYVYTYLKDEQIRLADSQMVTVRVTLGKNP